MIVCRAKKNRCNPKRNFLFHVYGVSTVLYYKRLIVRVKHTAEESKFLVITYFDKPQSYNRSFVAICYRKKFIENRIYDLALPFHAEAYGFVSYTMHQKT